MSLRDTLFPCFRALDSKLHPPLFPAAAVERLGDLVRTIPFASISAFECPLDASPAERVDFCVQVPGRRPAWSRLLPPTRLVRSWARGDTRFEALFVEFDLAASGEGVSPPALFVGLGTRPASGVGWARNPQLDPEPSAASRGHRARSADEPIDEGSLCDRDHRCDDRCRAPRADAPGWHPGQGGPQLRFSGWVELAEGLVGGPLDERTVQTLWRIAEALGEDLSLTHLAVMDSRPERPLRLNVAGPIPALADLLAALDLPPALVGRAGALLDDVAGRIHHGVLALDLTHRVRPCVGIECYVDSRTRPAAAWTGLLDLLVGRGWCPEAAAEAVLRWPQTVPGPPLDQLPESVARVGRLVGLAHASTLETAVNHLKIVAVPESEPRVKAYLRSRHTWAGC